MRSMGKLVSMNPVEVEGKEPTSIIRALPTRLRGGAIRQGELKDDARTLDVEVRSNGYFEISGVVPGEYFLTVEGARHSTQTSADFVLQRDLRSTSGRSSSIRG